MTRERDDATDAAVHDSLRIIGDRWSILIVRAAFRGIRRFEDLRSDLGISKPVLAERLKRLVDHGILERHRYEPHPPRYEYRLTEAGRALSPALVALVRWAETYVLDTESTLRLEHAPCGTELEQAFWCRTCASTFGPAEVRGTTAEPG